MIPSIWNDNTYKDFIKYLYSLQDIGYRDFHQGIVVDSKYEIIGIRLPIMRNVSKELFKGLDKGNLYEEVMIEGLVISKIKDEDTFYKYFNKYIDKIDNWALCDTFSSSIKIVEKYLDKYFKICKDLIKSNKDFRVRLGFVMILGHFISNDRVDEILKLIDESNSDKYYINMARAWLIAELYIKEKNKTLEFIKNNNVDKFTINKAISKINDSYRVSKEEKEYLKQFRK